MTARADSGFSLIEMLVAMAILAMTATALLDGQAGTLRAARTVSDKTIAGIVADSRLAVALGAVKLPAVGSSSGDTTELGRAYRWQQRIEIVTGQDLMAVHVFVFDHDGKLLTQRTGFRRVE